MAFKTSRTFTSRGRPPRLAGGIAGSTSAHSASVKSLGYRKPRRFAARRCSGVHIEHPLASIRVLDNESHPIPPTQQLLGSALSSKRWTSFQSNKNIETEVRTGSNSRTIAFLV